MIVAAVHHKTVFVRGMVPGLTLLALLLASLGTSCAPAGGASILPVSSQAGSQDTGRPAGPQPVYRIARVMSFHSPWKWTDDQSAGFAAAFAGLQVEYRTWQLDAKRQSEPGPMARRAAAMVAEVRQWQPDLVYSQDDPALNLVVPALARAGFPVVFSGVNGAVPAGLMEETGLVTGVYEKEFFPESLRLLRALVPGTRRMAVVWDDDNLSWQDLVAEIRQYGLTVPGLEFPFFGPVASYAELQRLVLEVFPGKVDSICFVGVFGFKDAAGRNVPYQQAMRWIAEHSRLPDLTFWEDRVDHGGLCGVCVTGYGQGQEAGSLARSILVDHIRPLDLAPRNGTGGQPMVSLRRARELGLQPPSSVLLGATVKTAYAWDGPEASR